MQASVFVVLVDTMTVVEKSCLNMDSAVHSQVETNLDYQALDNEDALVVLHYDEVLQTVLVMNHEVAGDPWLICRSLLLLRS